MHDLSGANFEIFIRLLLSSLHLNIIKLFVGHDVFCCQAIRAPFKTKMGDHELNSALPDQLGLREHVFLNSSTSSISPDYHVKRRHSRAYSLAGVIAFIGVGCLVAGIVLISVSQSQKFPTKSVTFTGLNQTKSCDKNSTSTSNNGSKFANPCEFSKEAARAGKPIKCRC